MDLFGELYSHLLLGNGPRTLAQYEELSLKLRPKLLLPRINALVLFDYLFRETHVLEHLLYPMKELLPALILDLTYKLELTVERGRLFVQQSLSQVLGEEVLENVFGSEKPEDAYDQAYRDISDLLHEVLTLAQWVLFLHHLVYEDG